MTFFERYSELCQQQGIEPCSQKAAEMFNTTRATISTWGKNNSTPRGETVAVIADGLGVSTDYLLGRTEDPTDYTRPELIAELAGPVLDEFNGDVKKAAAFQQAVADDVKREREQEHNRIMMLYNRLDEIDRVRVESYIEGILTGDKYKKEMQSLA